MKLILILANLFLILGEGDVFGDNICTEPTVGQSAVDVHALTYSDLHCIQRDALIEVLEFYPEFAFKFAKNLSLSYNLRDEVCHRILFICTRFGTIFFIHSSFHSFVIFHYLHLFLSLMSSKNKLATLRACTRASNSQGLAPRLWCVLRVSIIISSAANCMHPRHHRYHRYA